jgi:acyl carrier protein
MDITVDVRQIVRELLDRKNDHRPFADDDSLVVTGRLASVDVLDLVLLLEERFGADFSSRPFDQYEFDSVNAVVRLLDEINSR